MTMWSHVKKDASQISRDIKSLAFVREHDHFRLQWVGFDLQHC